MRDATICGLTGGTESAIMRFEIFPDELKKSLGTWKS